MIWFHEYQKNKSLVKVKQITGLKVDYTTCDVTALILLIFMKPNHVQVSFCQTIIAFLLQTCITHLLSTFQCHPNELSIFDLSLKGWYGLLFFYA